MFIVFGPNTLKLRRSAMLREHFAPTGFGRCGLALTINIGLLTELSCECSNSNDSPFIHFFPACIFNSHNSIARSNRNG